MANWIRDFLLNNPDKAALPVVNDAGTQYTFIQETTPDDMVVDSTQTLSAWS